MQHKTTSILTKTNIRGEYHEKRSVDSPWYGDNQTFHGLLTKSAMIGD